MKKATVILCVVLFLFGMIALADAAPKYYTFRGTLTHTSTTPGGSPTLITDQGIDIGDEFTFVFMIDFDLPGEITRNNGNTDNAGDFYAEFIASVPEFEGVNRDYNTDPQRVAQYNYGRVTEYEYNVTCTTIWVTSGWKFNDSSPTTTSSSGYNGGAAIAVKRLGT